MRATFMRPHSSGQLCFTVLSANVVRFGGRGAWGGEVVPARLILPLQIGPLFESTASPVHQDRSICIRSWPANAAHAPLRDTQGAAMRQHHPALVDAVAGPLRDVGACVPCR